LKIFIDTNIILDVFLERQKLSLGSGQILSLHKHHQLGVSLLTFTTGFYIIEKDLGKKNAYHFLDKLSNIVNFLSTGKTDLRNAIHSGFNDFEDAIQYFTAKSNGFEAICTRNVKDFKSSDIPVHTPEELLDRLKNLC